MEPQASAVHQAVLDALPAAVDASYLCPHHPEGTLATFAVDCPNRKPAAGAILTALGRFGARARDCLLSATRKQTAWPPRQAVCRSFWASEFSGWAE